MKRARLAAIAAALAAVSLALTACSPTSSTPAVSGTVVGKDYDRGTCRTVTRTIIVGKVPVPQKATKCSRDEYELDVRDQHGDVHEVDVDRRTYDRTRIGDRYPKGTP